MTRALGIDIGAYSIKIAELDVSGHSRNILGLYEIFARPGASPGLLLREFFAESGLQAERISVGMGGAPVYVKRLEFPFHDRKRLLAAVQGELEDSLPFDISEHIVDVKPVGRVGRLYQFLCGVCPAFIADEFQKIVDEAGILPTAFHLDSEALGQLALNQCLAAGLNDQSYAVCDLGHSSTKIAIVRGCRPQAFDKKAPAAPAAEILELRTLTHGSGELLAWIRDQKRLSEEEARQWLIHRAAIKNLDHDATQPGLDTPSNDLSDEIKVALRPVVVELYQTLQSYKGRSGQSPQELYLTGGMSELRGLREFLSDELRLPVSPWPVFQGFTSQTVSITPEKTRSFAIALALAHRYALRKPEGWLNFRRSPQASRQVLSNFFRRFAEPELRPVLLSLALCLGFVFFYATLSQFLIAKEGESLRNEMVSEFRRLDRELGKRAEKFSADVKRSREIFEGERKKREGQMAARGKGVTERSRSDLLLDLSQVVPSGGVLREFLADNLEGGGSAFDGLVQMTSGSLGPADLDKIKKEIEGPLKSRGYADIQVEKGVLDRSLRLRANWKGK